MSNRMRRMDKNMKRLTQDDVLIYSLVLIFAVAVVLLSAWHNSFDQQGFFVSNDRSTNYHTCRVISDNGTSFNIIIALIVYIAILIASTGLLSYLTSSVYDSISEASFLSFSFMLGIIGLVVKSTINVAIEPSTMSIFTQNVVTWGVVNLSMLALYVPKLIEAWTESQDKEESFDIRAPMTRISAMMTEVSVQISQSGINEENGSVAESDLSHMNLLGGYLKYRIGICRWSKWVAGGFTLFHNNGKKWMVFEFDKMSVAWNVDDKTRVVSKNGILHIVLNSVESACVEVDSSERMTLVSEKLTKFLPSPVYI
ncbi:hypothetical protein HDU76_002747 [Blyttiomyces sp. JEL0837]|nr:hypothetical protein HDU76_002747 [Blyttiomyces sp. JEL0837]